MGTPKGQRKLRHVREQTLILLCGFLAAVWMRAPENIFWAFVVGLGGLSGAFVLGNVGEHKAEAEAAKAMVVGATAVGVTVK